MRRLGEDVEMTQTMTKNGTALRGAILVLTAALLAGCSGGDNSYFPKRTGYYTPPQRNEVAVSDFSHVILLEAGQRSLSPVQVDGLNQFLTLNGRTDGDYVEIRTQLGNGGTRSRNGTIAADLRQSFIRSGYAPSHVDTVNAFDSGNRIEIAIRRYDVVLPDCSGELKRAETGFGNEPIGRRNLGCSNERNFGLMLADPRDLDGERGIAPSTGQREYEAIDRYRRDAVKELDDGSEGSMEITVQ